MFDAFDYKTGRPLSGQDVSMARSIIEEHCRNRQCLRESNAGLAAAPELVRLFQSGISDRGQLQALLDAAFVERLASNTADGQA